ncbi:MAG: TonB-dependent receptor, partial [Gammaproteobacteria bacterium]|nr:TonB-dependent receptor [Gammaproteobacteria bacterium]
GGRDLANKVDMNRQGSTDVSRDAVTLHATYELTDNLSIKYILGDSDLTLGLLRQDFDGTSLVGSDADPFLSSNAMRPFPDIAIDFVYDVLLTTHELQLAFDTERLSAIAGAYYLDQEYESNINIFDYANRAVHTNTDDLWRSVIGIGFTDIFGERLVLGDDRWISPHVPDGSSRWYFAPTVRTVESWAVFSQATYEINSAWRVTAGLRYTEDEKRIVQDEDHVVIGEFDPLGALLGDGTDFTRTAPAVFNRITPLLVQNFDKVTGNVSIEHTTARGELIYGRISTGYRSGGPVIDRPPPFDRYDDENLISYEAGYKGDLFEDRVRLLVSGFLYDFGNYQQIIRLRELEPVPRNFTVIDNLPDTTMQGIEIEATFNVSENVRLSGFYAYQTSSLGPVMIPDRLDPDQEFDRVDYVSPNTGQPAVAFLERPVDLEGNELPNMPNHKWSATADYAHPLGNGGRLLFSTSYSFTGERFNRIHNIPYDVLDSYTRWDGSVTWIPATGNRSLTFFVENINDRIGIMELESNGWSDGYYQDATLTDPQFMGLVFRWEMQ